MNQYINKVSSKPPFTYSSSELSGPRVVSKGKHSPVPVSSVTRRRFFKRQTEAAKAVATIGPRESSESPLSAGRPRYPHPSALTRATVSFTWKENRYFIHYTDT